jgi:AAA family ATP:ADP antiporter
MNPLALLRRLVLVKEGEVAALVWSAGYFFCILFAYYLISPFRDEMGMRQLENLRWLWTATTVATVVAAAGYSWLVSRLPRRRFIPVTYLFFAANLVVFWALFLRVPPGASGRTGQVFYVWVSVFNLFLTTVFWGFTTDLFTTEQAKRLFGAVGVGGTLGAICGSSVPATLVRGFSVGGLHFHIPAVHLLLVSVVFLILAIVCVRRLVTLGDRARATQGQGGAAPALPAREPGRGVWAGLLLILRSPYLLTLCAYMLLFTVTSALLSFEQLRIVKASFPDSDRRVAFQASINFFANVVTLTTQLFVTGRILTRLGVMVGLMVLPVITGVGFGAIAAWSAPTVLLVVVVARRGMHYAVDRPTREVLYTVLGPEEKYKSKSFIDTVVYRGGDLLGAWTDHFLTTAGVAVAATAIGISAVWGAAGFALGRMQRGLAARNREVGAEHGMGVDQGAAPSSASLVARRS